LMPDPADQFALVPLPPPGVERDAMTASALMIGPMSTVTEPILSSLAREATEQLLNDTANAIEEEHRLTAERQRAEQQAQSAALQSLCDGISRMAKRLDAHEKRCSEAARKARADERKAIRDGLFDPDNPDDPHTANTPGFGPLHIPGSGPSDYSEDEDAVTGDLPSVLEKGAPPELGDHPTYKISELKHPQEPIPQTPTGIGGP
jgi:hypothetical protein